MSMSGVHQNAMSSFGMKTHFTK